MTVLMCEMQGTTSETEQDNQNAILPKHIHNWCNNYPVLHNSVSMLLWSLGVANFSHIAPLSKVIIVCIESLSYKPVAGIILPTFAMKMDRSPCTLWMSTKRLLFQRDSLERGTIIPWYTVRFYVEYQNLKIQFD